MILVTVGTHEDPFDRLIDALDDLVDSGRISDTVRIQRGYSKPSRSCDSVELLPFDELQQGMAEARIVITHGGPASIMQALTAGKVPVVVPRRSEFGEHVDNHQVLFTHRMADRVIVVDDIAELGPALANYDELVASLPVASSPQGRADAFSERLEEVIQDLLGDPQ